MFYKFLRMLAREDNAKIKSFSTVRIKVIEIHILYEMNQEASSFKSFPIHLR